MQSVAFRRSLTRTIEFLAPYDSPLTLPLLKGSAVSLLSPSCLYAATNMYDSVRHSLLYYW